MSLNMLFPRLQTGGGILKLMVIGFAFSSLVSTAAAQENNGNVTYPLDFDSVKVEKTKTGWEIAIQGKRSADMKLPSGAIIDFALRWRFKNVDHFSIELKGGSRKFKKKFTTHFLTSVRGLLLRAEIMYSKQPKAVREYIDKHKDDYFPGKGPWVYTYGSHPINLGSEAEVAKQQAAVKAFFKTQLEAVIALESKLRAQIKLAEEKKAFHKDEAFDPKAWQAWIEKDIRDPIRKIQKESLAAQKDLRFLNHSRDLETYLPQVTQIIARRSYENSKALYKTLGLKPDKADLLPKNIHTNAKRYRAKDLVRYLRRINDSQQLGLKLGK